MDENKKPTSIYLYTALIFMVALIMILLSFFGQKNIRENEELHQQTQTLTEKATVISEENLLLTEQVSEMQKEIEEKDNTITSLTNETEAYKNLITVYSKINEKSTEEDKLAASELFTQIDPAVLTTDDAQKLYNMLAEIIGKED